MRVLPAVLRVDQWLAASPLLLRQGGKADDGKRTHSCASRTVFFPGCSLAAYSPDYVLTVRDFIRERRGDCEVLMACCAKPLRLMGKKSIFQRRMDRVRRKLDNMGAETVITACQNCFKVLREQDGGRRILSLWPLLLRLGLPDGLAEKYEGLEVSIQDSCVTRDMPEIAASVRELLKRLGVTVREMACSSARAKCCGGITTITTGDAKLGREAMRKRAAESPCSTILSYCASCRSAMGIDGEHRSLHLLDLIFGDGEPLKGGGLLNRWRAGRLIAKS